MADAKPHLLNPEKPSETHIPQYIVDKVKVTIPDGLFSFSIKPCECHHPALSMNEVYSTHPLQQIE